MLGVLWCLNQQFPEIKREERMLKSINVQRRLNTQKINRSAHKKLAVNYIEKFRTVVLSS